MRVKTNFLDGDGTVKNLDAVLTEIVNDLNNDYGNVHADEVLVKEDIPVIEANGDFKKNDILEEGSTMSY